LLSAKLGFVGFGNMGAAIGVACCSRVQSTLVFEPDSSKHNQYDSFPISFCDLESVFLNSDIIFLAIKPQQFDIVSTQIAPFIKPEHVLVSMLAGVTLQTISTALNTSNIVRIMPNTPAVLKKGVTGIYFSDLFDLELKSLLLNLFSLFGQNIVVEDESHLHTITAISGSGPAFCYRFANVFTQFGKEQGLSEPLALKAAAFTMLGAAEMLTNYGDPEQLIKNVTSPNGTTFAGLKQMDQLLFDPKLKDVLMAAYNRSIELSKGAS